MSSSADTHPAQRMPIPALLRAARGAYGAAIRERFAGAGFDDIPRNGSFVLGGMANQGESAADLLRGLGVSKQAASQLADTLVVRGYLTRAPDPGDGRRIVLELTDRGRAAALEVREAVEDVDRALGDYMTAEEIAIMRRGLFNLWRVRASQA